MPRRVTMPMTVRLRDAAEYSEAAQKMFELSRAWFDYDFTRPPAMSRVMAWDPEFGGPHGRAMKRAMAPGEFTRAEKEMVAAVGGGGNACAYWVHGPTAAGRPPGWPGAP